MVKTYNYSGGIVLLYQNKMDKYAYVEEITFDIDNLDLENDQLTRSKKLEIELEPQTEKLLSFVVSSPGKEVVFRTKISFYLNSPEFKFWCSSPIYQKWSCHHLHLRLLISHYWSSVLYVFLAWSSCGEYLLIWIFILFSLPVFFFINI